MAAVEVGRRGEDLAVPVGDGGLDVVHQSQQAAERDEEKELIIDTLSRYPSPKALAQATASLSSEKLRDKAAAVSIAVAGKIAAKHPKKTADAMQKVIESGVQGDLLNQAKAIKAKTKK